MAKDSLIVSVDFGSNSIKLVVARDFVDGESDKLQILALMEKPSQGIRRGIITNMDEATESLIQIVSDAETTIGLSITNIIMGANGAGIKLTNSAGLAVISSPDREIFQEDVNRLLQDSLTKTYGLRDSSILHFITKNFIVDNQSGIKNPVGMLGNKIEAETLAVSCDPSYLRNFSKVANEAGLEVDKYIFLPIASSDFLLSQRQKKAGTIFIDIGHSATSYIIWEEEEIFTAGIIPIGSEHVTADLAVGLQTTMEMAEEIKRKHLDLSNDADSDIEEIEMYNPDLQINENFNMMDVKSFSKARVEEIFIYINQELRKHGKQGRLAGGAVISGGGANIKGIVDVAKQILRLPVFKYTFDKNKVSFFQDYNNDPIFFNAISAIVYHISKPDEFGDLYEGIGGSGHHSNKNNNNKGKDSFGSILKKIFPF